MKKANPKVALERITTLKRVWGTLRKGSSYYGKTFEQFCAEVQPSLDARAELDTIDEHRAATAVRRDEADLVSLDLVDRIIAAIKAHPDEGEDGEVYAGLGYVRKGLRTRGRRRPAVTGERAPEAAQPEQAEVNTPKKS